MIVRAATPSIPAVAVMLASSLALLAGAASTASAQPAFSASIAGGVESLDQSGASRVSGASADAEYTIGGRARLFYGVDAGTYAWPGDWGYALQRAGIVFEPRESADRTLRMSAGASGAWRLNGPSWETANYRAFALFGEVESRPAGAAVLRSWGRADVRAFSDLDPLDHHEYSAGASVLRSIQSTRTTLIAELNAGRKRYAAGETAQQLTVLARVAQNLTDLTGVSLQFASRGIGGAVPPMLVETPGFILEDGVYDDPYASTLRAWDGAATRLLGRRGQIKVSAAALRKGFDGSGRADTIRLAGARWEIPLLASESAVGMSVTPRYAYTRSRSTIADYNYTSHALGIGLTVTY